MAPLRPAIWLLNLALLATVAYTSAALAMGVLERNLERDAPVAVTASALPEKQKAAEPLPLTAFQPVLDDNIFGARRSQVKPVGPEGPVDPNAPVVDGAPPPPPPPPKLEVTLSGTVIMGDRSFAMVADAAGRNEKLYRLWDCIPGGEDHPTRTCAVSQGKLMVVRSKHIVVEYQGERLTFELAKEPPKLVPAVAVRPPAARGRPTTVPPPGGVPPESLPTGNAAFPITQEGNVMQVRVPGAEVSKAFENFADVLKQARVVPYTDDSGTGFQIRNIRSGSIFERIGLNNFDKIKAVNGEPITTADQALRLLTMFRNEKEIVLDLQRGNQDLQLNYVIE